MYSPGTRAFWLPPPQLLPPLSAHCTLSPAFGFLIDGLLWYSPHDYTVISLAQHLPHTDRLQFVSSPKEANGSRAFTDTGHIDRLRAEFEKQV